MLADRMRMSVKQGVDEFTKALLHFDNSVIADETGRVWSNHSAFLDAGVYKFGKSIKFDSTWIDTPASADFNVGSGDFTVDFWVNLLYADYTYSLCGQVASSLDPYSAALLVQIWAGYVTVRLYNTLGGDTYMQSSTTLTASQWYHIAVVRKGNSMYLYINGVQRGSRDVTGIIANASTAKFAIGKFGESSQNLSNNYIDEFRFSKGIARWTANFSPPTSPY